MIKSEASKEVMSLRHCLFFKRIIHDTSNAITDRRKIKTKRINIGNFDGQAKPYIKWEDSINDKGDTVIRKGKVHQYFINNRFIAKL